MHGVWEGDMFPIAIIPKKNSWKHLAIHKSLNLESTLKVGSIIAKCNKNKRY